MAKPLADKVVVITGSSRGIGKILALRLAEDGARIVVSGRTEIADDLPGTIGDTVEEIRSKGGEATSIRLDLDSDESIDALVDQSLEAFGRIDVFVNNAVLVGPRLPLSGGTSDFLDRAYRINVRAPYRLVQRVGLEMKKAGGGTLINISSGAATHSPPPTSPATPAELGALDPSYGMTKAALDRMTTAYASELMADNVAIISVSPGLVITERIQKAAINRNVDLSRAEPPEVIADAVSLIARDGMRYTGRILFAQDLLAEQQKAPSGRV
jgi:NAD(P)-dependent dehydrogenase (short-subunit alcohol dehydrogenase family)